MKAGSNIPHEASRTVRSHGWDLAPSLLWLFFIPLFVVMAVKPHPLIVGVLFLASIGALYWFSTSHHQIWRKDFFVPIYILLISNYVSYFWVPQLQPIWIWISLVLSGLWIKFSIRSLGIEESYKFVEWSKSANAMISLSILYSAGLVLLKRYNTLDISFISSWLPIILVVLTYLTHEITFHIRKKQLPTPAHCPNHTPIIRISIIKDDKIWLTTHPYTGCCSSRDKVGSCIEKDKLDLPLNTCQLPGETIDDVLRRVEQDSQLELEEPPKHLISYTCDDGRVRHVFVIQSEVKEPQLRGDFFTAEQVTELYAKDKLNSYLTEEYNYLKNTLFLAHKINKSKR